MDLREVGLEDVYWMYVSQNRDHWWPLLDTIMNIRVP